MQTVLVIFLVVQGKIYIIYRTAQEYKSQFSLSEVFSTETTIGLQMLTVAYKCSGLSHLPLCCKLKRQD